MIKIGIVDDLAIVRSGLRQFFSEHVDLRVLGDAASGREAIDLVRTTELDVLVMDLLKGRAGPGDPGTSSKVTHAERLPSRQDDLEQQLQSGDAQCYESDVAIAHIACPPVDGDAQCVSE